MKITYTYNNREVCTRDMRDGQSPISALVDWLYIDHELTPSTRDAAEDLALFGKTVFDYHSCEFVDVEQIGIYTFRVTDRPAH